jgi:hypothetical protein
MIDLAGVDQVLALTPPDVDAVELLAVQRVPCDRQRLALGTGLEIERTHPF